MRPTADRLKHTSGNKASTPLSNHVLADDDHVAMMMMLFSSSRNASMQKQQRGQDHVHNHLNLTLLLAHTPLFGTLSFRAPFAL